MTGLGRCNKQLVGPGERPNFRDLLHRQVGRPFIVENAVGVDASLSASITNVRSVARPPTAV